MTSVAQTIAAGELRARLAAVLKAEVESLGMTPAALVEASGLPRRTVYNSLAGDTWPRDHALAALCPALGLTLPALLEKMAAIEV